MSPKSTNRDKKSNPSKSNPMSPKGGAMEKAGTMKIDSILSKLDESPAKESTFGNSITSKLSKAATMARDKAARDRMMA